MRDLARALGWRPCRCRAPAVDARRRAARRLPLMPAEAHWINAFRVPVVMDTSAGARALGWAPRHDARAVLDQTVAAARGGRAGVGHPHHGRQRASVPPDTGCSPAGGCSPAASPRRPLFSPEPPHLTTIQRWTLVVVCAATAMLMLDIAVVNTALSRIAEDLSTGLSGLQWVVDAYTLALASVVLTAGSLADRLGRRRLFTIGLVGLHRSPLLLCAWPRTSSSSTPPAPCRASAPRSCSPSRSRCSRTRSPAPRSAAGALAAYGATIGASFAIGPLVGGLLTERARLAVDLPRSTSRSASSASGSRARYVQESRDPSAHGIDWPGQITLTAGLFLLVLALLRGNEDGWAARRSSPSWRAPPSR